MSSNCRWRVFAWETGVGSSQWDCNVVFEARVPTVFLRNSRSVLSTVAARSKIGQELSCFCPAIIIGGNDHAPLHLLGILLDGLWNGGGSKAVRLRQACRAEYQTFVQEQRQLEWSSTRSRPDVGDVLSFCSLPVGFRGRQCFFKVCIATNMVKPCDSLCWK